MADQDRDVPLDFHWSVPRAAMTRAGLKATGKSALDRTIRSIAAALVLASHEGKSVSYSRRRLYYAKERRYLGLPYTYETVTKAAALLVDAGLATEVRALPCDHVRTGRQSTLQATPALIEAFRDVPLDHDDGEILRLRDENGRRIGYIETEQTRALRRELDRLNKAHNGIEVTLVGEGVIRNEHALIVDGMTFHPTPSPSLYAVYNRGRWDMGGRIYWWGQSLPKARRADLLINGQPTVEIDYASLHPRLLYAAKGLTLDFDPYEVDGFERWLAKVALLVMLNARSRGEAIRALMASGKKGKPWPLDKKATSRLVDAVRRRNLAIASYLMSDAGIRLMHRDARIARAVMKACVKQGICCLPVHDSFIVQQQHEAALRAIMDAALKAEIEHLPASDLNPSQDCENTFSHSTYDPVGVCACARGDEPVETVVPIDTPVAQPLTGLRAISSTLRRRQPRTTRPLAVAAAPIPDCPDKLPDETQQSFEDRVTAWVHDTTPQRKAAEAARIEWLQYVLSPRYVAESNTRRTVWSQLCRDGRLKLVPRPIDLPSSVLASVAQESDVEEVERWADVLVTSRSQARSVRLPWSLRTNIAAELLAHEEMLGRETLADCMLPS